MKVNGFRATLGVGITEPSPRVKVSGSRATIWGIVGLSDPSPRVKLGGLKATLGVPTTDPRPRVGNRRAQGDTRSRHDRPEPEREGRRTQGDTRSSASFLDLDSDGGVGEQVSAAGAQVVPAHGRRGGPAADLRLNASPTGVGEVSDLSPAGSRSGARTSLPMPTAANTSELERELRRVSGSRGRCP